jgi:hypothetical protein
VQSLVTNWCNSYSAQYSPTGDPKFIPCLYVFLSCNLQYNHISKQTLKNKLHHNWCWIWNRVICEVQNKIIVHVILPYIWLILLQHEHDHSSHVCECNATLCSSILQSWTTAVLRKKLIHDCNRKSYYSFTPADSMETKIVFSGQVWRIALHCETADTVTNLWLPDWIPTGNKAWKPSLCLQSALENKASSLQKYCMVFVLYKCT